MRMVLQVLQVLCIALCSRVFSEDSFCLEKQQEKTVLLSSPSSGTHILSCCLHAITRKPIGYFPDSIHTKWTSILNLDLISDIPFLYRTHVTEAVRNKPAEFRRLIFLTRNPKELLFRNFSISEKSDLQSSDVQTYLDNHLDRLKVYDAWPKEHRVLVFYEDFIDQIDETLFSVLDFIQEKPVFAQDYLLHKEEYLEQIYKNYTSHSRKLRETSLKEVKPHRIKAERGNSSKTAPQALYYTQDKSLELLQYVDQVLREKQPEIWDKYLKRFETAL